jgi:hypothetical protein
VTKLALGFLFLPSHPISKTGIQLEAADHLEAKVGPYHQTETILFSRHVGVFTNVRTKA